MTFSIRPEAEGDAAAVRAVHASAFPSDAEARLVDALRKAGRVSVSLVAAVEGQIVGHVLFSPVTPGRGLGLAPLAVLPRFQELGIGSELVESGLDACEADYAVVLGDPAFYARFGFRRALDYGLDNEYGAREEFMVLELRPGALDGVRGRVQYSPEFAVFR
ncbi:MAG TPA: N-acetyltransferase [Burkholderiales bacterium]|nr:N-acetyltransferase [Burkholderiales bacterium]